MAKITKIAQRSLMAAAALAAMAGSVQAQNVTIYGRVDVGVEHSSKVADYTDDATDDLGSRTSLANGGHTPSIWGFRGSEDLGGGLKAVFNLEGDFDGSTGGNRFGGALNLFGRQANVGVSGGFGTVLLGRQYSPALLADLGTEPRGFKESFSSLLPFALTQAPETNAISPNNFLGIFTGNMISYSNSFGPVNLGVGYGFGEVVDETSRGSTISLGVSYNGPITVSASYQRIEGLSVAAGDDEDESTRYSLGVSVPFGALTFKAYYANAEIDNTDGTKASDTDFFGLGMNWAWNAQNTLTIAYYQGEDDEFDGDTMDIIISNDYALSKRTTLYAHLVYTDIDDDANPITSIAVDRSPVVGDKTTTFGIGLVHNF